MQARSASATLALVPLLLDLALLLLVIHQYQLVSRSFFHIALLAAVGFAVHAHLPLRHRLPFFAALSIASLGVAFGFRDGAWLFLLGSMLILICHLPVRFGGVVLFVAAAGAVLAAMRAGVIAVPWSPSIWPILGSMFMFRIALYLHARKHEKVKPTPALGVAYFFMLPNVCFPLFPVVDYATFARTHFEGDALETYRTGIVWMVRGLFHLILYRLVYLHLVVDPADIADAGTLVQHLLSTFLLYLRVSGEFHLVVGLLHLFGFRLPETHRLYYLASSFTDFWRRINIYWKDFMMKLVYFPSFFRLRRWGATRALVASTVIVFAGTWVLHSYQWFWLRGDFPLTLEDGLFWGVLGALVVVNAVREAKRGRDRSLGRSGWSAALALRTVGTFTVLCILWSLWSAESVSGWLWMWTAAGRAQTVDLLWIGALLAAGLAVAGHDWGARRVGGSPRRSPFGSPILRTRILLAALVVSALPGVAAAVSPRAASIVASVRTPRLNARDEGLQHRGYYERMDNVERLSTQLWETIATQPADWVPLSETAAWRQRDDFLLSGLRPSTRVTFHGATLSVNRWGMRDRDVTLARPAGVYRIALLGPSIVMGAGVGDDETIAALLEARLNRELGNGSRRFEVLNFGVSNRAVTQQAMVLDDEVLRFDPDMVVIADSPRMKRPVVDHMLAVLSQRIPVPYAELATILEATGAHQLGREGRPIPSAAGRALAAAVGVPARMPYSEAQARVRLAADDIVAWSLQHIARATRASGAVAVFAVMDNVGDPDMRHVPAMTDAAAAGMTVFDLRAAYAGHDQATLWLGEWDRHPNPRGNRLIADLLFDELRRARLPADTQ